jgi:hypothetical protein
VFKNFKTKLYCNKMKWYYFYTADYDFYNRHISSRLTNHFDIKPILIDKLELSTTNHHFDGLTVKLNLVYDAIQENMNEYIVFSDATIFIHPGKDYELKEYMHMKADGKRDILFVDFKQDNRNIGLLLIRCTDMTLNLFKDAIELVSNNTITWDQ